MSLQGFTKISEEIQRHPVVTNPYGPNPLDFVSNVAKFQIIESTLREGEQFANAFFNTKTKLAIARALDDFGVDYIEVTSPLASEQSRRDCEAICQLGLKAKILTHIRCRMEEAEVAVQTGVAGVDIVIEASQFKSKVQIEESAVKVIEFIKSKGIEMRFSLEDSFRSNLVDLLGIYKAINDIGVDRVGIADTIGCANPRQVYELVRTLKSVVRCEIECHFHNDTGCAIANAYTALEAGARMVDVSVLGIGERNGITPLGGFILRMIAADRNYVLSKYKLHKLRHLENLVAEAVCVNIPFNNPITGFCAFTHKAGPHARAILAKPATYEILKPSDFGLTRYIHFANRLTGWSAIKSRVDQLNLQLTDEQCKDVTERIKKMGDVRPLNIDDVDSIIKNYHADLSSPEHQASAAATPKLSRGTTPVSGRPEKEKGTRVKESQSPNKTRAQDGYSQHTYLPNFSNNNQHNQISTNLPNQPNQISTNLSSQPNQISTHLSNQQANNLSNQQNNNLSNQSNQISTNRSNLPSVSNQPSNNSHPEFDFEAPLDSEMGLGLPDFLQNLELFQEDMPFQANQNGRDIQQVGSQHEMDQREIDQALEKELRELNDVFNGDLETFNAVSKVDTPADMDEMENFLNI